MKLSNREIDYLTQTHTLIRPFTRNKLQPASYDCSLDGNFIINGNHINWDKCDEFIIHPYQFMLASTIEQVKIPNNLICHVKGKSSIGRLGLDITNAGVIDPGFKGNITLQLFNKSNKPINLKQFDSIAQLEFEQLSSEPYKAYNGHYQNQDGITGSRFDD